MFIGTGFRCSRHLGMRIYHGGSTCAFDIDVGIPDLHSFAFTGVFGRKSQRTERRENLHDIKGAISISALLYKIVHKTIPFFA